MVVTSHSPEQTLALGHRIGALAPADAVTCIALDGPLGAGKTHLTRGIAEGAAVFDPSLVSSPTYVLLNIYEGPKPIYHVDAYRIHGSADLAAAGLEEILAQRERGAIVVVEWAARIGDLLPADRLHIAIEHDEASDHRVFCLTAHGPQSALLLGRITTNTNDPPEKPL
jgi:tRNA threonylcarbamoyladenosine biosynthesis protein TsaE